MSDDGGVAAMDRALSILDALTDDKVSLADLSKRPACTRARSCDC